MKLEIEKQVGENHIMPHRGSAHLRLESDECHVLRRAGVREDWNSQDDWASEAREDFHKSDLPAMPEQRSSAAASFSWTGSAEAPLAVSRSLPASTREATSQWLPPDEWGATRPGLVIITLGLKYARPGGAAMEHVYPGLDIHSIMHRIDDIYRQHHYLGSRGTHRKAQQEFKIGAPRWMEYVDFIISQSGWRDSNSYSAAIIACWAGHHRSVALAEITREVFRQRYPGYQASTLHLDLISKSRDDQRTVNEWSEDDFETFFEFPLARSVAKGCHRLQDHFPVIV